MGLAYTYQEMYVFPQSTLELLEEKKVLIPIKDKYLFIYYWNLQTRFGDIPVTDKQT